MLRSTKKIKRHHELLSLLLLHPEEGLEAVTAAGLNRTPSRDITRRQERGLINDIKERVNGTDHS